MQGTRKWGSNREISKSKSDPLVKDTLLKGKDVIVLVLRMCGSAKPSNVWTFNFSSMNHVTSIGYWLGLMKEIHEEKLNWKKTQPHSE